MSCWKSYKDSDEYKKKQEDENKKITKFMLCVALPVSILFAMIMNFFNENIQIKTETPTYDYTVQLTYGDGSTKVVTDHADYRFANYDEPQIESPVFHKGYYVEIDNHDYYGVVAVKTLRKTKASKTKTTYYHINKTRYEVWKNNPDCSLWTAFFSDGNELLKYKN